MSFSYLLPEELKDVLGLKYHSLFKCFHINTRSLNNKLSEIELLLSSFHFSNDVIMFTETWLSDDETFILPHYKSFFLNRSSRRGGGVSLLVSNELKSDTLDQYCVCSDDYEILTVITGDMVLSVIYRPPDGNISNFINFIDHFLAFINEKKLKIILGGDLNLDMMCDNIHTRCFNVVVKSNNCENVISKPTRVTCSTETLLDLFITNYDTSCVESEVLLCDISDHLGIFMGVEKTNRHKKTSHVTLPSSSLKKA